MQKRTEVRRSTIISAEVASPYWSQSQDLIAADISPRGMYLISDKMPQVGDCLCCSFSLTASEESEFYFFSRVKRINWHRRKTDRMRPGFGVEFMDVTPKKFVGLERALRGVPPPVPSKRRRKDYAPEITYADRNRGDTFVSKWFWHHNGKQQLNT